jgi:hypothetical protein
MQEGRGADNDGASGGGPYWPPAEVRCIEIHRDIDVDSGIWSSL